MATLLLFPTCRRRKEAITTKCLKSYNNNNNKKTYVYGMLQRAYIYTILQSVMNIQYDDVYDININTQSYLLVAKYSKYTNV